jgi:hypothetical protein
VGRTWIAVLSATRQPIYIALVSTEWSIQDANIEIVAARVTSWPHLLALTGLACHGSFRYKQVEIAAVIGSDDSETGWTSTT